MVTNSLDMNEYLKPMSRDILLFTTKIANTYKLKDKAPLLKLELKEKLFFKRVISKYDDNLITINNSNNELISRRMTKFDCNKIRLLHIFLNFSRNIHTRRVFAENV